MEDATSVHRYQQPADDFITSRAWGLRPEITEAPSSISDDSLTTQAMIVTQSIPASISKGNKPAVRKSTAVPTQMPTVVIQTYIDQLAGEKKAVLAKPAKMKAQQTTASQFLQRTAVDV